MSPNNNLIKISSKNNSSSLVLTVSAEGASLGLETANGEPPSPNFNIDKNSDAYLPFLKFFSGIKELTKNNVIFDELVSIEHAPLVIFRKEEGRINLYFAIEKGFRPRVRHIIKPENANITNLYVELFNSLIHKKKAKENSLQSEMAKS